MKLRYDREADVLYIKFARTKPINQSELTDADVLIEYDAQERVVGLTILNASSHA